MKGGTRTVAGVMSPPLPVKRAWVEIGVSSPAPPGCCSGDVEVCVGVVGCGAVAVGVVGTVAATLGGGALTEAVWVEPPPPPQPASASSAAPMRSPLNRMRLTGLEDHDLGGRLRLDVRLERLIVGLD